MLPALLMGVSPLAALGSINVHIVPPPEDFEVLESRLQLQHNV